MPTKKALLNEQMPPSPRIGNARLRMFRFFPISFIIADRGESELYVASLQISSVAPGLVRIELQFPLRIARLSATRRQCPDTENLVK